MEDKVTFETYDKYSAICMLHATDMAAGICELYNKVRMQLKHGEPDSAMKVLEETLESLTELNNLVKE